MMGWLILIGLALASGALLLLIGFPRHLWMIAATALTLGAAGYAFQGHPGLAGSPVKRARANIELDPAIIALREAMFGRFNYEAQYFGAADAMMRTSAPDEAATVMIAGVRTAPKDAALWTWLGMVLVVRDGVVTPAARFAFDRAIEIAPRHPGPSYFLALVLAGTGEGVEARGLLARAVQLTPEKASYRPTLVAELARLDSALAVRSAAAPAGEGAESRAAEGNQTVAP